MSQATIQTDLNSIATQQVPGQPVQQPSATPSSSSPAPTVQPRTRWSSRSATTPGRGPRARIPAVTVINGAIDVSVNQCSSGPRLQLALDNFWRSVSNLTINVDRRGLTAPAAPTAEIWSASRPRRCRRAIVNGNVTLSRTTAARRATPAAASSPTPSSAAGPSSTVPNQQFMVRTAPIGGAAGCRLGLWNMVYSGVQRRSPAPDLVTAVRARYTVLAASPVTEEEPFLYTDSSGNYNVFVPAVQHGLLRAVLGQRRGSLDVRAAVEVLRGQPGARRRWPSPPRWPWARTSSSPPASTT